MSTESRQSRHVASAEPAQAASTRQAPDGGARGQLPVSGRGRLRARSVGVGAGVLALVVTGVGAATAAPAYLAPKPAHSSTQISSGKAAVKAVKATGSAPAVSPTVVDVVAPFALSTTSSASASAPAGGFSRVITAQQAVAGTAWTSTTITSGASCPDSGEAAAAGLTPNAIGVLNCIHAQFPQIGTYYGVGQRASNSASDHPSGRAVDAMIDGWNTPAGNAFGWTVAHTVEANVAALKVKYIIFDAQIYLPGSGWKPYHHPSGATDPTSLHLDHVHVSVRQ